MKVLEARPTASSTTVIRKPDQPTHVRMTPQQWIAVADNPRQRNTERHLKSAKHLLNPSSAHAHVHMAICGDKSWKLDGHTRALLWSQQPSLAPETIHVVCHYVDSEDEAKELYTHFDNLKAAESSQDKVSGAYREIGFEPQSWLLKRGAITSAIRRADNISEGRTGNTSPFDIYELIHRWKAELTLFDSIDPQEVRFDQITVIAALITLRKHRDKALEFWRLFNLDAGTKIDDEIDAIEALNRLMKDKPSTKVDIFYSVSRAISCYESWRRNHNYKLFGKSRGMSIKSTDLKAWFNLSKDSER